MQSCSGKLAHRTPPAELCILKEGTRCACPTNQVIRELCNLLRLLLLCIHMRHDVRGGKLTPSTRHWSKASDQHGISALTFDCACTQTSPRHHMAQESGITSPPRWWLPGGSVCTRLLVAASAGRRVDLETAQALRPRTSTSVDGHACATLYIRVTVRAPVPLHACAWACARARARVCVCVCVCVRART